jgi:glycosyltransferase involved in cell wall biosynthesis
MKIILAVPEYPPFRIGGGGIVFENLAREYSNLGHEVHVIYGYYPTRSWSENISKFQKNRINFIQVPLIPTHPKLAVLNTVLPALPQNARQIPNIIKEIAPDVVHIHGYGHFLMDQIGKICKEQKIPYLFTNHGYPKVPLQKPFPIKQIWQMYCKFRGENLNQNAAAISCVSRFTASEYSEQFGELYNPKLSVISNGINIEKTIINSETQNSQSYILNKVLESFQIKPKIILSVGRIAPYKGFKDIIQLLPSNPDILYIIAGKSGDFAEELITLSEALNVANRVVFLGEKSEVELAFWYTNCDLVVIPSSVESFGLVGLEALKYNKVVIHSGVQGLVYLNDSINAYNYNSDILELNSLLQKELNYKDEDFISKFKWSSIALQYLKILQTISKKI